LEKSKFEKEFSKLEEQIGKFIRSNKELSANYRELKNKTADLQNLVEKQNVELEELKEKNRILRIAKSSGGQDNREMKLKINEMVREVDKCIAQLNQ
jgi:chromosome segregation ATPase